MALRSRPVILARLSSLAGGAGSAGVASGVGTASGLSGVSTASGGGGPGPLGRRGRRPCSLVRRAASQRRRPRNVAQ